jgi:hypothetical protein
MRAVVHAWLLLRALSNMRCCLVLLQDLAVYLGVGELNSTASFPTAMDTFKATLARVEACSATRSLVEGDTAALCASIKAGAYAAGLC